MAVYQLNPVADPRWGGLIERHPRASVFHTSSWLEALQRTYGYQPVVFTTSAPGAELTNGVVFCEIRSWLTGWRLVSLPFSDHCEPLVEDAQQLAEICAHIQERRNSHGWTYVELRPLELTPGAEAGLFAAGRYWLHSLSLQPEIAALFQSLHKDSIQRKIQRARREGLAYAEGQGEELMRAFYRLLLLTRQRHQLPPQPYDWFANLATSFGPGLKVRVASHRGRPIAAIVTVRHRDVMVYKYGASDAAFHNLGGMQLLFWTAIQDARAEGCLTFDLGRSDLDRRGLAVFKERWGALPRTMTYWRCAGSGLERSRLRSYLAGRLRHALAAAPDGVRVAAGRMLYKHVG